MLTKKQINKIRGKTVGENDRLPIALAALGDPGRFRIFKLLLGHRDICVTDVAAILGLTMSAASQQLRVLERTGLVRKERMGQMICYKIRNDDSMVKSIIKLFL